MTHQPTRAPRHARITSVTLAATLSIAALASGGATATGATTAGATTAGATTAACTPAWHVLKVPLALQPGAETGLTHASLYDDIALPNPRTALAIGAPESGLPSLRSTIDVVTGNATRTATSTVAVPGIEQWPVAEAYSSTSDGWALTRLQYQDILQHWDGMHWHFIHPAVSPSPDTVGFSLSKIVALSPRDAWAVGNYYNSSGPTGALTEHWNGTSWSIVGNPAASTPGAFGAISASSATDIWAVGRQINASGAIVPLTEHFDGARWTQIQTPAQPLAAAFHAVDDRGNGDIWVTGAEDAPAGSAAAVVPLVEHFDGKAWHVVGSMVDLGGSGSGAALYAATSTDVWVSVLTDPGTNVSFLHWNGAHWQAVPAPAPQEYGVLHSYLAMSGSGPGNIYAAGFQQTGVDVQPELVRLSC